MSIPYRLLVAVAIVFVLTVESPAADQAPSDHVTATKSADGSKVSVKIDGQPFAQYLIRPGHHPIVWPIYGPTGKPMTRQWPMAKRLPGEPTDHPHHRSLWFTHGNVNGQDFWTEGPPRKGQKPQSRCLTVHREFLKIESGREAVVATRNDWLDDRGKKMLEDRRTLRFGGDEDARWIDFDITLSATEGPVTLGDTKEGTMGLRVAAPLAPDAKQGGRLVNSHGQVNDKAWSKPASWVDYSGPIRGETVGVCMMNHPSSFRYPTHWHARTYGLCAANPFGLRDFSGDPAINGSYTIPRGESITFRYRVLLHKRDAATAKLPEAFEAYVKQRRSCTNESAKSFPQFILFFTKYANT
ncbi:MAG TPA: PmoA family protein [Thermoguttaceae bacterium]|nr:PmoA family protein [Thermoguttaceae bacterium]